MAKKKKQRRNPRTGYRNAAPRSPRSTRTSEEPETATQRLGYTAAGAAGTALLGAVLAKQGWAPKTIAGTLTALGAGLAWKGDGAVTKSLGAGTMSAAGGQLTMMLIDDHETKQAASATIATKKPANADGLPPGALESAFERARERLAMASAHDDIE